MKSGTLCPGKTESTLFADQTVVNTETHLGEYMNAKEKETFFCHSGKIKLLQGGGTKLVL